MGVTWGDVVAASRRIAGEARRTPVVTCEAISDRLGMSVFLKCENLQKVGAFKFRGATNAVRSLSDAEAEAGVVTHSSGNHAQALALAAKRRGIRAWVVMPENAPSIKRDAVLGYGATVVPCAPTLEARETTAAEVQAETGATFVHPYDDDRVIAGQGTAALELLEDVPDLQAVICPVGGGGLLSGTCVAAHGVAAGIDVYAGEPEAADDAHRSLVAGHVVPVGDAKTVADGLRTSLCERTFEIIQAHVREIVCVAEAAIVDWMRFVWERAKLVIEPSAAVPLAALDARQGALADVRVGVILSGGNVDLDHLPWTTGLTSTS